MQHPTNFSHLNEFGLSTDLRRVSHITEELIIPSPVSVLTPTNNNEMDEDDEPPALADRCRIDDDDDDPSSDDDEGPLPEDGNPSTLIRRLTENPYNRRPDGGYTLKAKKEIVALAYPNCGPKQVRRFARKYRVHHSTIIHWKRMFDGLESSTQADPDGKKRKADDAFFSRSQYSRLYGAGTKLVHTAHAGRHSYIPDWAQVHLLRYFDRMREDSLHVGYKELCAEYLSICPENVETGIPRKAIRQRIYRFCLKFGIVGRATTHQAQNQIHAGSIIEDWTKYIKQQMKIYSIPLRNVANFDETNVNYDMPSRRCLSRAGKRTINIKTATSSQRCTAMLGCAGDGKKFAPYIIFKAKPGGLVQRRELSTLEAYPKEGMFYSVQANAWMDEPGMMDWLEKVWFPFSNHKDRGGFCLLILDEFKGHMVSRVVQACARNNTILEFVPPGYTSKLQVMDVGLNRPFKLYLADEYHEFIQSTFGVVQAGVALVPRRHDVAWWIYRAWNQIKKDTVTNTWRFVGVVDIDTHEHEDIELDAMY
jgi:hypothetical protein